MELSNWALQYQYALKTKALNQLFIKFVLTVKIVELTLMKLDLTWLCVNSTLSLSWIKLYKVLSPTELFQGWFNTLVLRVYPRKSVNKIVILSILFVELHFIRPIKVELQKYLLSDNGFVKLLSYI